MVLGHQKGRDTKENIARNFGMARPEGYRKAERLMRHAEKFGMPVITFIDTPGAEPGIGSEERGQSTAIAESLLTMAGLRTPIVAVVIGEGGSGGALAIGVADRVLMLENAIYSVASPEACAAILWKDVAKASEAAATMRITAADLLRLRHRSTRSCPRSTRPTNARAKSSAPPGPRSAGTSATSTARSPAEDAGPWTTSSSTATKSSAASAPGLNRVEGRGSMVVGTVVAGLRTRLGPRYRNG